MSAFPNAEQDRCCQVKMSNYQEPECAGLTSILEQNQCISNSVALKEGCARVRFYNGSLFGTSTHNHRVYPQAHMC